MKWRLLFLVAIIGALNSLQADSIADVVKRSKPFMLAIYNSDTYWLASRGIDSDDGLDTLKQKMQAKSLVLSGNRLSRVTGSKLLAWQSLEALQLDCNGLKQLDAEILVLPTLKELDVSHNSLTELPDFFNEEGCCKLVKVNVANNKINVLPDSIFKCALLRELNIANNQMPELQEGIGAMRSLKKLILFDGRVDEKANNVVTLPVGFVALAENLEELWINAQELDYQGRLVLQKMQRINSNLIICQSAKEINERREAKGRKHNLQGETRASSACY